MRREERVTVQGPVKEQQPDGMSHRGAPPPPMHPCQGGGERCRRIASSAASGQIGVRHMGRAGAARNGGQSQYRYVRCLRCGLDRLQKIALTALTARMRAPRMNRCPEQVVHRCSKRGGGGAELESLLLSKQNADRVLREGNELTQASLCNIR